MLFLPQWLVISKLYNEGGSDFFHDPQFGNPCYSKYVISFDLVVILHQAMFLTEIQSSDQIEVFSLCVCVILFLHTSVLSMFES